jgi:NADH:ubiquinone oxidoreductase subunit 5 (subunit L)/multisubunit Na+/H+ antiporter MnhA subunit
MVLAMRFFGFRVPLVGTEVAPKPSLVERLTARVRPLYVGSYNKWWFDDLNDLLFVRIGGLVARAFWWFDVYIVDGTVNAVGTLTQGGGRRVRQIQTGRVQNYALGIAVGLIVMAVGFLWFLPR